MHFHTFGDEEEHVARDVQVLPRPLVLGILGVRTEQEAETLGDRLPDHQLNN